MIRPSNLPLLIIATIAISLGIAVPSLAGTTPPEKARKLYDDVTPSLVGVQFTWTYEYGKAEYGGEGVVISDDGLIAVPMRLINPGFPDVQLTDFKVIVPHFDKDDEELDATFQGRDERTDLAFVRVNATGRKWKPVKFEDAAPQIGDTVASIGLLPKMAGYRSYFTDGTVAAQARGEIPMFLVTGGGLGGAGSPVFNSDGKAIGLVNYGDENLVLYTSLRRRNEDPIQPLAPVKDPSRLFVPSADFIASLQDPPTPDKPVKIPWLGAVQLTGLQKDVAEVYGLENQPAVEVGDVVQGSPADKGGLKVGMKIVKVNGQPLKRGDEPEELGQILNRQIHRMAVGSTMTLSVITEKDKPAQDLKITLEERPKRANQAKRFWAEDLGFAARELVWEDTYVRKQPVDFKGIVVALIKPSSAAASAKLAANDVITQLNNNPVTDIDQFAKDYQAFRKEKPKEALVLVVLKPDASTQTVRIEPPQ